MQCRLRGGAVRRLFPSLTMTVQTDLPAEQTLFRGVSPSTEKLILARLYGEPLETVPDGLYIPPEALRVFLESFEGPLDLLLYLIRRQKFDIMDIPMAEVCEQYMRYVEMVRENDLELASAYLVMSATLMQIKSRMLLPAPPAADGTEPEDPRVELMRRLLEYEKIRNASVRLQALPRCGRDFHVASAERVVTNEVPQPEVTGKDVAGAWLAVIGRLKLNARHRVTRQELSVREHMTAVLKLLTEKPFLTFETLVGGSQSREVLAVWFLAVLELAREGAVILTQGAPYAPLYVTRPESSEKVDLRCPTPEELGGLFAMSA